MLKKMGGLWGKASQKPKHFPNFNEMKTGNWEKVGILLKNKCHFRNFALFEGKSDLFRNLRVTWKPVTWLKCLTFSQLSINGLALRVKSSADNILKCFFLIFLRKQDLIFHANCLQWRQFAWDVNCLLGKIIKTIINLSSAELAQRVVKVNLNQNCLSVYQNFVWYPVYLFVWRYW